MPLLGSEPADPYDGWKVPRMYQCFELKLFLLLLLFIGNQILQSLSQCAGLCTMGNIIVHYIGFG
jgi:hypothetical protein